MMTENSPRALPEQWAAAAADRLDFYAGLDIGGTKTAVLIVDDALQVVGRGVAPTVVADPEQLVSATVETVREVMIASGADPARLLAVGAGVPGMVEPESGHVRLAVNLKLQHYALGETLAQRFKVPVALENDVRAAALGAFRWLNGLTPVQHMAYLSVGTGISAGVVLEGRLHRGAHGMAGEIGHVIFDPQGAPCLCGLNGCLETISAGPSIARQWPQGDGTAEAVFRASQQGDPQARSIITRAGEGIARAIQLLVMAFDIQKVVLGGGILNAGEAIMEPIQASLAAMRASSRLAEQMLPPDLVLVAPREADVARWGAILLALQAAVVPPMVS